MRDWSHTASGWGGQEAGVKWQTYLVQPFLTPPEVLLSPVYRYRPQRGPKRGPQNQLCRSRRADCADSRQDPRQDLFHSENTFMAHKIRYNLDSWRMELIRGVLGLSGARSIDRAKEGDGEAGQGRQWRPACLLTVCVRRGTQRRCVSNVA